MDLRKLESFCRVVEEKSFTRAAEAMLLAQPTVSEHVRNLEEQLGQKLVDRLGREVVPTPAGRLLYGYARRILTISRQAVEAVEQFGGTLTGRIMIGSGTIPGTYILPALIGQFRQQYPTIKTTLQITGSRNVGVRVLEGALEMGVVGARWKEERFIWERIFADELTLIVPPDHVLASRTHVTLQDIMAEPFVLREPASGTRQVFARILRRAGYRESMLKEVAEMGSTAAVTEAVKAGLGVAVVSRRAARDGIRCGTLAEVRLHGQDMNRHFYLILRKNRQLSPVTEVFLDFLRSQQTTHCSIGNTDS